MECKGLCRKKQIAEIELAIYVQAVDGERSRRHLSSREIPEIAQSCSLGLSLFSSSAPFRFLSTKARSCARARAHVRELRRGVKETDVAKVISLLSVFLRDPSVYDFSTISQLFLHPPPSPLFLSIRR